MTCPRSLGIFIIPVYCSVFGIGATKMNKEVLVHRETAYVSLGVCRLRHQCTWGGRASSMAEERLEGKGAGLFRVSLSGPLPEDQFIRESCQGLE